VFGLFTVYSVHCTYSEGKQEGKSQKDGPEEKPEMRGRGVSQRVDLEVEPGMAARKGSTYWGRVEIGGTYLPSQLERTPQLCS
jgi:hypothetical protein